MGSIFYLSATGARKKLGTTKYLHNDNSLQRNGVWCAGACLASSSVTAHTYLCVCCSCHQKVIKCVQIFCMTAHNSPLKTRRDPITLPCRLCVGSRYHSIAGETDQPGVIHREMDSCQKKQIRWSPLIRNDAQATINSNTLSQPESYLRSNWNNDFPMGTSNVITASCCMLALSRTRQLFSTVSKTFWCKLIFSNTVRYVIIKVNYSWKFQFK